MKKTGLYGNVYEFSINYDAIANYKIPNIYKFLMEKDGVV